MATTKKNRRIVGGVDTHSQTHHAAVQLMNGARVADAEFPVTTEGYAALLTWLGSFGRLYAVGVEGTGSYGAGLARHLCGAGITVIEVNRPDRRQRRAHGKSDPLDAYAAADAVLAGRASAVPKLATGIVESIRVLHRTRAGAVKARTAAINELRGLLITAPAPVRERLDGLALSTLIDTCAHLRIIGDPAEPERGGPVQRVPRPLSEAQVAALLARLRRNRDRAIVLLMLQVGYGQVRSSVCICGTSPTDGDGWWCVTATTTRREWNIPWELCRHQLTPTGQKIKKLEELTTRQQPVPQIHEPTRDVTS